MTSSFGAQLLDRLHDLQIDYYWCVWKREITFAKNFFFSPIEMNRKWTQ